jgi:hypothetical protein
MNGEMVAVKELKDISDKMNVFFNEYHKEIITMCQLQHPCIVKLLVCLSFSSYYFRRFDYFK